MNKIFITIGIISYNNEDFIEECIESCLNQTYSNYEIIVSDDASTDGSIKIIQKYVDNYPSKIKAIYAEKNSGIARNFNSAVKAGGGEWIKTIAADDLLLPNCLKEYVTFIEKNDIKSGILFSRVKKFGKILSKDEITDIPTFFSLDQSKKLKSLLMMNTIIAPGAFFNMKTLNELGLADERYPFLEDYPLWIKAQIKGVDMINIDAVTVKYRLHESISHSKKIIGHIKYYESCLNFAQEVLWPKRYSWGKIKNFEEFIQLRRIILSIKLFDNKKTMGYYIIELLTKPLKFYTIFKLAQEFWYKNNNKKNY